MNKRYKKSILIYLGVFLCGIIIGSQIPSFKTYLKNRKLDEQAQKQLARNPEDPNNWVLIGMSKWRKGDKEGSLSAIQKALDLDPNYVYAMEIMAFNFMDVGNYEDAEKWLIRALARLSYL